MRRVHLSLALVLLASGATAARGDGAFPNAMQVLARAGNTQELHLGATFGLITTEDFGAHWSYVCEPYITGGTNVILYAQEPDGTLLALADKLWRSSDAGCTWTLIAPPGGAVGWSDVFIDPTVPQRAYAISFTADSGPRALWESSDGAQSFPTLLDTGVDGLVSVESAASKPEVIYATNAVYSGSATPLLARSRDGGATWTSFPIAAPAPSIVRILAVSPDDPDTLWLRASNVNTSADDLWFTSDGGQTLSIIYSSSVPLTGFARSSDGTLYATDGNAGLLVNAPASSGFVRVGTPHFLCLGALGARLFGCGDSLKDAFNLAFSDDRGQSWSPLLSFPQITGPAACVQSACASDWVYQQTQFAALEPKPGSGCGSFPLGGEGLALLALLVLCRSRSHRMVA